MNLGVDLIFLYDYRGKFIDFNIKACESLGYARVALLGPSM